MWPNSIRTKHCTTGTVVYIAIFTPCLPGEPWIGGPELETQFDQLSLKHLIYLCRGGLAIEPAGIPLGQLDTHLFSPFKNKTIQQTNKQF